MAVGFNRSFSITRVVKKLVYTILALYVGGTIMNAFGDVMKCTNSAFYEGMTLIGWTVSDSFAVTATTASCNTSSSNDGASITAGTYNNLITDTTGSGVLAVIGIIGLAGVVLEFISFK